MCMVFCFHDIPQGRRIGNIFCPSLFKYIAGSPISLLDMVAWDPYQATSLQVCMLFAAPYLIAYHHIIMTDSAAGCRFSVCVRFF